MSGIGQPDLLKAHVIDVQHALPGVGENYRDHYGTHMRWRFSKPNTHNEKARGLPFVRELMRYADSATRALEREPGMTLAVCQMRPESQGTIHINLPDPETPPAIRCNFLSEPGDVQCRVDGMKIGRRVVEVAPFDPFRRFELAPGDACQNYTDYEVFARAMGQTLCHISGTAKMGPSTGRMALVDGRLRVHGLEGLRVIDASIMPALISGNTNVATVMIAEKGAEMVLEECRINL